MKRGEIMAIPKTYDAKGAQEYLGIGRYALEGLCSRGLVARFKVGGSWRYAESDLDAYYQRQRDGGLKEAQEKRGGKTKHIYYNFQHQRKEITKKDIRRAAGLL